MQHQQTCQPLFDFQRHAAVLCVYYASVKADLYLEVPPVSVLNVCKDLKGYSTFFFGNRLILNSWALPFSNVLSRFF